MMFNETAFISFQGIFPEECQLPTDCKAITKLFKYLPSPESVIGKSLQLLCLTLGEFLCQHGQPLIKKMKLLIKVLCWLVLHVLSRTACLSFTYLLFSIYISKIFSDLNGCSQDRACQLMYFPCICYFNGTCIAMVIWKLTDLFITFTLLSGFACLVFRSTHMVSLF